MRGKREGDGQEREHNVMYWAANYQADVKLRTRDNFQAEVVFEETPSRKVIDYLELKGFQRDPQQRVWTRAMGLGEDREFVRRTFHTTVDMILKENS